MMPLFEQKTQHVPSNLLVDRYGWPPFSILNTISHDWQRRKDEWECLIKDSTVGRDTKRFNATPTNTFSSRGSTAKEAESVSTFDPYLAELMYRWFSRVGDKILDPFAGGCVRGEVAAVLGRHYTGVDLSVAQIEADRNQYIELEKRYVDIAGSTQYLQGDSDIVLGYSVTEKFNMVFTCPPYYNLERYTKSSSDLSNLPTYTAFLNKYGNILYKSSQLLADDSFFVIVVSEIRECDYMLERSQYLGLVPDTIHILRDKCELSYYNEIILENNIGSLPIRAPKYFDRTRKIGRHHQNILVFYKGNIAHIEEKFDKF